MIVTSSPVRLSAHRHREEYKCLAVRGVSVRFSTGEFHAVVVENGQG